MHVHICMQYKIKLINKINEHAKLTKNMMDYGVISMLPNSVD